MFTYYEPDTAPEESKSLMEQSLAGFGMIPNLHKILAEAPATYKAYNQTFTSFMKETTFSPVEQQVVFMTSNFENNCHYCVPGHTWMMKSAKIAQPTRVHLEGYANAYVFYKAAKSCINLTSECLLNALKAEKVKLDKAKRNYVDVTEKVKNNTVFLNHFKYAKAT